MGHFGLSLAMVLWCAIVAGVLAFIPPAPLLQVRSTRNWLHRSPLPRPLTPVARRGGLPPSERSAPRPVDSTERGARASEQVGARTEAGIRISAGLCAAGVGRLVFRMISRRPVRGSDEACTLTGAKRARPAVFAISMSAEKFDPYEVLGVGRDADAAEIRRVFRRRARELHPDVSDDPDAPERFRELVDAVDVLLERERPTERREGTSAQARARQRASQNWPGSGTSKAGSRREAGLRSEVNNSL